MAKQLDASKLKSLITSNVDAVGDASHSIITTFCVKQPQPNDENAYLSSDNPSQNLAGPVVMNALLRAHGKAAYEELIYFPDTFSKIPETRASAGWLWEHWANAQISDGGDFTLKPIAFEQPTSISDMTQPIQISIPSLKICCFGANEPTPATCGIYFIPINKNNATFDAFFHYQPGDPEQSCGIGLQMTLSDTHSLKAKGLKSLYDRLQARQDTQHMYVVVIREGHNFKNFKPTPSRTQQKRFRFFTMELALPTGMYLFLP